MVWNSTALEHSNKSKKLLFLVLIHGKYLAPTRHISEDQGAKYERYTWMLSSLRPSHSSHRIRMKTRPPHCSGSILVHCLSQEAHFLFLSYFSLLSTKEMLTRIYILRLFKKGVFTCLKVRLREKEIFHLLFYYPDDWNSHKKARSFTGSHTWVQRPDMWLLFHCFSQTMSRKLDLK